MEDFKNWYKVRLNEAWPQKPAKPFVPSDENPLGNLTRKAVDAWHRWRKGTEVDWDAIDPSHAAAERKYKRSQSFGDPDDPAVRESKYKKLARLLYTAASQAAPKARPETLAILKKSMSNIAASMTLGRPILYQDVENMLVAVHKDKRVNNDILQRYWRHHLGVFDSIIEPIFQSNPDVWYNPQATTRTEKYPPGTELETNEWRIASQKWMSSPFRSKKGVEADVLEIIKKDLGIQPQTMPYELLFPIADNIRQRILDNGGKPIWDAARIMHYSSDYKSGPLA